MNASRRKDRTLNRRLWFSWAVIFIFFATLDTVPPFFWKYSDKTGGVLSRGKDKYITDDDEEKESGGRGVRVYEEGRQTFRLWKRDDAIRFAFDNVANTVNYLFVGASVLLGLIGKFSLDPILDDKKKMLLKSDSAVTKVKHAAIGCLFSIAYGFIAYSNLAKVADQLEFSIYDDMRAPIITQILALLWSALLIMWVINSIVKESLSANTGQRLDMKLEENLKPQGEQKDV